jgi:hypothetical protein
VTKSSNHTPSLLRLTFNSSSTTNFPWLSPTDNSVVLLQFSFLYSLCCTYCTPCTPRDASFRIRLSYISSARNTQHRKHSPSVVTTQLPSKQSQRGPHRKYRSFLSHNVIAVCLLVRYPAPDVLYCRVLLYALLSNGCLPRICLRGNVSIEPLPSSG